MKRLIINFRNKRIKEQLCELFQTPEDVEKAICFNCSNEQTACFCCLVKDIKENLSKGKLDMNPVSGCFDFNIDEMQEKFTSADSFIDNTENAIRYILQRREDAKKLVSEIKRLNGFLEFINLTLPLYSAGQEVIGQTREGEVIVFKSPECATAYILAKYW